MRAPSLWKTASSVKIGSGFVVGTNSSLVLASSVVNGLSEVSLLAFASGAFGDVVPPGVTSIVVVRVGVVEVVVVAVVVGRGVKVLVLASGVVVVSEGVCQGVDSVISSEGE